MLHPRYLIKRVRLVAVFAVASSLAAFFADPKPLLAISDGIDHYKVATPWLVIVLLVIAGAGTWLLWILLETRYVCRNQALAASALFLVMFVVASLGGIVARGFLLGSPSIGARALLDLAIISSAGSAAIAAIYNVVFVKTDYTTLRAELRAIFLGIDRLIETFGRDGYLRRPDLDPVTKDFASARATALGLVKIETPAYGTFIDSSFAQPLVILSEASSSPALDDAPEGFLRACGLIDERCDETVAAAYRLLRTSAAC